MLQLTNAYNGRDINNCLGIKYIKYRQLMGSRPSAIQPLKNGSRPSIYMYILTSLLSTQISLYQRQSNSKHSWSCGCRVGPASGRPWVQIPPESYILELFPKFFLKLQFFRIFFFLGQVLVRFRLGLGYVQIFRFDFQVRVQGQGLGLGVSRPV